MKSVIARLWNDDAGIVALEYLLVATFVGLASIVGLNTIAVGLNSEFVELYNAIVCVNQDIFTSSYSTVQASNGGTAYDDTTFPTQTGNVVQPPPATTQADVTP